MPSPTPRGTDQLRVEVADGVARLTLHNPDRLNAISFSMRLDLPGVLADLAADPDVRVLVVAGSGSKAFASGADISEFGERRTAEEARAAYDAAGTEADRAWASFGRPVIAMIRGWCLGGGLLLALQADIRICSDDARFGIPAARLGLGYAYGGVEALLAAVGPAWTAEMLYSARRLDAGEAAAAGLVNRVVPAADLEAAVGQLAGAIRDNAPLTVAAAKAAIRDARRPPAERDRAGVEALVDACFRSADYREGQAAFAEKRAPRFTGR